MQKLYKAVVALLVALAIAWTPSFTSVASAEEPHDHAHAGIFVMTDDVVYVTGELGSGLDAELEPGEVFHVYYDTQRLRPLDGEECFPVEESDELNLSGNFEEHEEIAFPAFELHSHFGALKGYTLELTGGLTALVGTDPVILQNLHQLAGEPFEADYVMLSPPEPELEAPSCSVSPMTMDLDFNLTRGGLTICSDQASVPVSCD
ncbi:MAG: hypothetical protein F6K36_03875 [Symploca sp. SIO3C6]|nr:hypothetical protein [Symploca sp. SIO3C6]